MFQKTFTSRLKKAKKNSILKKQEKFLPFITPQLQPKNIDHRAPPQSPVIPLIIILVTFIENNSLRKTTQKEATIHE